MKKTILLYIVIYIIGSIISHAIFKNSIIIYLFNVIFPTTVGVGLLLFRRYKNKKKNTTQIRDYEFSTLNLRAYPAEAYLNEVQRMGNILDRYYPIHQNRQEEFINNIPNPKTFKQYQIEQFDFRLVHDLIESGYRIGSFDVNFELPENLQQMTKNKIMSANLYGELPTRGDFYFNGMFYDGN